ncbi:MAG: hypothetical protein HRT44_11240 [Bdellovibrionales bacterium]|nr:hypothetical protein [Bdellovibrionales bacterium]
MLYILPRVEVDEILPITMSPAANTLERAFVARLEIMLDTEEKQLVRDIMQKQLNFDITTLGRFAEPKLRRAQQVYLEEQKKFQSSIPGFAYGLNEVFETLVQKSLIGDTSPLIVDLG